MTKSNENLTKERKSFKEVLVENKGKIIAGVGTVVITGVSIVLLKDYVSENRIIDNCKRLKVDASVNSLVLTELWEKVKTTEDIINNSGIIDQARATIIRKKDTLVGKLNSLVNMKQTSDVIKNNIEKIKAGIEGYDNMLDRLEELEYLYKCRETGENLLSD